MFEGIHKLEMQGVTKDYLKVRYAKGDILYVPVTQLDMVSKYIGPKEEVKVRLNRLGGQDWQKAKARVRSAVKDIAKELIQLYAERMQLKGYAFPPDTGWQRDFESRFEYEETEDQLRCIQEIKEDMEKEQPMDRLLCGDVGFGKTEVALRAAFKCVTDSKQCALLVPTTDTGLAALPDRYPAVRGLPHQGGDPFPVPHAQAAGGDPQTAEAGRNRHDHRHPPAGSEGRPVPGSGAGDHRRGAAVRRGPEGAV